MTATLAALPPRPDVAVLISRTALRRYWKAWLRIGGRQTGRTYSGATFDADINDRAPRTTFFFGVREPNISHQLERRLRPARCSSTSAAASAAVRCWRRRRSAPSEASPPSKRRRAFSRGSAKTDILLTRDASAA